MANYLVQDVAGMPKGMRFQVVKTKMEVFLDKAMEVKDLSFKTLYHGSRKEAEAARRALVQSANEPIFGMFSLFGVSNNEVAEWLYESGRLVGVQNYEAWFSTLSKGEQEQYRVDYAEAKAREAFEAAQAAVAA